MAAMLHLREAHAKSARMGRRMRLELNLLAFLMA
jgi:hypothetical protein